MWCPGVVYIVVTAMGWTFRKVQKLSGDKTFKILNQGIFLVVGIQNTHFIVGLQTWRLVNGERIPEMTQPGLNRHVVAVIDDLFIHYDIHNGSLFKYSLHCLVR